LPHRREQLKELEEQSNAPDLWDNPAPAQQLMQKLSAAREFLSPFESLETRTSDLLELIDLAELENDEGLAQEIARDLQSVEDEYSQLERKMLFSGEYDANNAIFSLNAGAGGTEAQDWAQMLVRAYIAGRSITNSISKCWKNRRAKKPESKAFRPSSKGTTLMALEERIGRASTGAHFAFQLGGQAHDEFCQRGCRARNQRSAGSGDQSQRLAPRLFSVRWRGRPERAEKRDGGAHHAPSDRHRDAVPERASQLQNREVAMRVLKSKLFEIEWRKRMDEINRVRGEVKSNEWGSQIRSYVFQPYQMVKDLRTGHETSDISGVMDGDFDPFIFAYLDQTVGQNNAIES
jgi:peptide chain release factor 2